MKVDYIFNKKIIMVIVFLVFIAPWYFIINVTGPFFTPHKIEIFIDSLIKFNAYWVYFYIFVYIFAFFPIFLIKQDKIFFRIFMSYALMFLLSCLIFIIFPVEMARPYIENSESFANWLIKLIYSLDNPYNCFPSLHLGMAFLATFITIRLTKRVGYTSLMFAVLIGISTMKIKQHYFFDVISGIILSYISYSLFIKKVEIEKTMIRSDKYILIPVIIQVLGILIMWSAYKMDFINLI